MLNLRRRRSLRLRRIWRLSFKECASGICSSRISSPTDMAKSTKYNVQGAKVKEYKSLVVTQFQTESPPRGSTARLPARSLVLTATNQVAHFNCKRCPLQKAAATNARTKRHQGL